MKSALERLEQQLLQRALEQQTRQRLERARADQLIRVLWLRQIARPKYLKHQFRREFDATLQKFLKDKPGITVRIIR